MLQGGLIFRPGTVGLAEGLDAETVVVSGLVTGGMAEKEVALLRYLFIKLWLMAELQPYLRLSPHKLSLKESLKA